MVASRYSSTEEFYSLANMLPNLRRYGGWTIEACTPAFLLGFLPPLAWNWFFPSRAAWRVLLTGVLAVVWLSYLPYFVFDDWWYLRFMLPAWPALSVLMVGAVYAVVRRLPGARAAEALTLLLVAALAVTTIGRARELGSFGLRAAEQRYIDAARYVAARTPAGSVVLGVQHSGSVRYYGARTTLRYDLLEPDWLDRAVAFLEGRGRRPYILLDDSEVPAFRARFAGSAIGALDWSPVAEWRNGKVLLFDAIARTSDRSPERIAAARGGCLPR